MGRSADYLAGYRAASRKAVSMIHALADEMNDPHARQVLNMAAYSVGKEFKLAQRGPDAPYGSDA